jgi:hypothetical protein
VQIPLSGTNVDFYISCITDDRLRRQTKIQQMARPSLAALAVCALVLIHHASAQQLHAQQEGNEDSVTTTTLGRPLAGIGYWSKYWQVSLPLPKLSIIACACRSIQMLRNASSCCSAKGLSIRVMMYLLGDISLYSLSYPAVNTAAVRWHVHRD